MLARSHDDKPGTKAARPAPQRRIGVHAGRVPAGLDGNPNPIVSPTRTTLLERVADDVAQIARDRRALVAVDGASGTGKSTFADELARTLKATEMTVVRASIDSFHRPRAERYRLGNDSPKGYYRDSHDLTGLRDHLLHPFAVGIGSVRLATFDEPSDQPLDVEEPVPAEAILVIDGLFLHRPELVQYWDLSLYLVADGRRESAWQSYLTRDLPADPHERAAEIEQRETRARRRRYVEGQALYERDAGPLDRANLVIDNDDLARPELIARRPTR